MFILQLIKSVLNLQVKKKSTDRILFVFKREKCYLDIAFRLFVQGERQTSRSFFFYSYVHSFNLSYSLYPIINQHFQALFDVHISTPRERGKWAGGNFKG